MSEFVKALEQAQRLPAGSEGAPYDPFAARVVDNVPVARVSNDPSAIDGAVEWDLTYHARRFYTGRELVEISDGNKIFGDRDETEEYQATMSLILSGKATVVKSLQQILSDGSVVTWLEWVERKTPAKRSNEKEPRLSQGDLLSPERVTPHSAQTDLLARAAAQLQEEMNQGYTFSAPRSDAEDAEGEPPDPDEPEW